MPPSSDPPQDTQQRKLAAILAADVAGYSRLMADDERATVTALKEARSVFKDKVEAHQGRLIDTAGDSVLAEFRSVVEAVQCSVEIQEQLAVINEPVSGHRKMFFRVGVNLGDVIEEADGTIYGDGVNIAARLESLAAVGGVNVSGKVYDEVKGKLEYGYEFLGEQEVKNIAEPVRAYRVLPEGAGLTTTSGEAQGGSKGILRRPKVVAGLVAGLATLIGVAVWGLSVRDEAPQMVKADGTPTDDPVLAMPNGPTIAVLPFDNMSDDPGQDYFGHGLSEDLLTRLSRFSDLRVIARNSSFQYQGQDQGQAVDIRQVGRELGTDFVLEGSVRREEDQIRVAAQLIETENGTHLWAETFEHELSASTVFEIQDEITSAIVASIGGSQGAVARQLLADTLGGRTVNLASYECVLLSYDWERNPTNENYKRARTCLEDVVIADPQYAPGWGALALVAADGYGSGYGLSEPERIASLQVGLDAGRQAIQIDPTNARAYYGLAMAEYLDGDLASFKKHSQRAIELNPNDPDVLAFAGWYTSFMGDYTTGLPVLEKAIALSPQHPHWWFFGLVAAHYQAGQLEAAHEAVLKIDMPTYFFTHVWHATIASELSSMDEAAKALARLDEVYPDFTLETYKKEMGAWHLPSRFIEQASSALAKAGLPDGEPEAPSRPIIAVLPFDNMSGDPEQEYFADGITEDIITRLAQFPDILVLGRNTTFQFKGQAVDIKTIAEKLGADYVVEGSIRRGGDTVRVTAQLLGGEEWTHLWAETYERKLDPTNLFAVQDEISEAVANQTGDPYGVISRAEFRLSLHQAPESLSSYECILKFYEFERRYDADTHLIARNCLEEVVATEPNYGEAVALLGYVYLEEFNSGFNVSEDTSFERALAHLERGVSLEPSSGVARSLLAWGLFLAKNPDRAIREVEEALRLAPNNVEVIAQAGVIFSNTGDYERTEELMNKVALINPNYPAWMNWNMAKVHLARGEYLDALIRLEMTQMGWWHWTTVFMAAAQCANGDVEAGRQDLEVALEAAPDLAEVYWRDLYLFNQTLNVRPVIDAVGAGLDSCGWDVPPDPGPEAFAGAQ